VASLAPIAGSSRSGLGRGSAGQPIPGGMRGSGIDPGGSRCSRAIASVMSQERRTGYRMHRRGRSGRGRHFRRGLEVGRSRAPEGTRAYARGSTPAPSQGGEWLRSEDGGRRRGRGMPNARSKTRANQDGTSHCPRDAHRTCVQGSPDQIYAAMKWSRVMRSLDGWRATGNDPLCMRGSRSPLGRKRTSRARSVAKVEWGRRAMPRRQRARRSALWLAPTAFLAVRMGVFQWHDQAPTGETWRSADSRR